MMNIEVCFMRNMVYRITIIGMFLMVTGRSYCQKSLVDTIQKEFSNSYLVSYKKLPVFIKNYLDQAHGETSSGIKALFNASGAGLDSGKKLYIWQASNNYMLNFDHKEKARHFHSIILKTDGKAIENVINLVVSTQAKVTEYSNFQIYKDTIRPIVEEFSENSISINSYNKLPQFIRSFLDQQCDKKFKISKTLFSSTDAGPFIGPPRKLYYILKSGDNYILSYAHGGRGLHFHSIIFKTNGTEILNIYNLTTSPHDELNELMEYIENGRFYVQGIEEV